MGSLCWFNNGCCIECEVVSDPDNKVEEVSVAYVPYVEPVAHLDSLLAAKQILFILSMKQ